MVVCFICKIYCICTTPLILFVVFMFMDSGGPEVLVYSQTPKPKPGPTQLLVQIKAAGVNFIDIYQRTGLYKVALPFIPGRECAGVIAEVGKEVKDPTLVVGAKVVCFSGSTYSQFVVIGTQRVVAIPKNMSCAQAVAALLQGLTAHYLTTSTYAVKKGDTVLVHAGAGGCGGLIIQICKILGAKYVRNCVCTRMCVCDCVFSLLCCVTY